ncbi:MAG: hypothetical protein ABI852_01300 [Gemmatimonadaceae bacterium]
MKRIRTVLTDSLIFAAVFLVAAVVFVMFMNVVRDGVQSIVYDTMGMTFAGFFAVQVGLVVGFIWSLGFPLFSRQRLTKPVVAAMLTSAVIAGGGVALMMVYSSRNWQVLRSINGMGQTIEYTIVGLIGGRMAYNRRVKRSQ